jgi:hypothetical protein
MDYMLEAAGGIDWDQPVRVTCLCCHTSHAIGAGDVLAVGVETACGSAGSRLLCIRPRSEPG